MRKILRGLAVAIALLGLAGLAAYIMRFELMRMRESLPPYTHSAEEPQRQMLAMRDGVRLDTYRWLPVGEGPWPVVLIRNPYERFDLVAKNWCQMFVRYGYGCVYQDARGQIGSEGEWHPIVNEAADGQDTLRWLVAQPWQDGNIALFGPSYLAAVQWAAASVGLPPEVKTFVPTVFASDPHAAIYQSGMFKHELATAWAAMMPRRGFNLAGGEGYQLAIRHRPHLEVDEKFFGGKLSWYRELISNPSRSDPRWQQRDFVEMASAPERVEIPLLMIGGWYDAFLGPQLDDYQRLASRSKSRLVIGPWTHLGQVAGDLESPNAEGGLAQWSLVLDWFDHHLRGQPLKQPAAGVTTYSLRRNEWVERSSWPPVTETLRFYLSQPGAATDCEGGTLRPSPPRESGRVSYTYDPADPVPTRGGAGMLAFVLPGFGGAPPASVLQDGLCERDDVLSFVSQPLAADLSLVGKIEVVLSVSSDAPDTSFSAKLIELLPDGRALNVREGIISLAYRNGEESPSRYTPGDRVRLSLEFWPIEWRLGAGSRLRLDVSSSDFPRFHAHPNRFGVWSRQADARPARQTLMTGPDIDAYLALPIEREPSAAQVARIQPAR